MMIGYFGVYNDIVYLFKFTNVFFNLTIKILEFGQS